MIGVPSADAAVPEPSLAQVSMVTVEAEREKVNVNVDPHDQAGGGTGFPKLERNSIDAASLGTSEPSLSFSDRSSDNVKPRQSIVGGEKERAEVLAAVKRGILKSTCTDPGLDALLTLISQGMEPTLVTHLRATDLPTQSPPTLSSHKCLDSPTRPTPAPPVHQWTIIPLEVINKMNPSTSKAKTTSCRSPSSLLRIRRAFPEHPGTFPSALGSSSMTLGPAASMIDVERLLLAID